MYDGVARTVEDDERRARVEIAEPALRTPPDEAVVTADHDGDRSLERSRVRIGRERRCGHDPVDDGAVVAIQRRPDAPLESVACRGGAHDEVAEVIAQHFLVKLIESPVVLDDARGRGFEVVDER